MNSQKELAILTKLCTAKTEVGSLNNLHWFLAQMYSVFVKDMPQELH